jgi:hypothetical protein
MWQLSGRSRAAREDVGLHRFRRFEQLTRLAALWLALGMFTAYMAPVLADAPPSDQALILLEPGADAPEVAQAVQNMGGRVTHVFPSAALIGQVPSDMQPLTGISAIYRQPVDEVTLSSLPEETRRAAQAWNALLSPETSPEPMHGLENLEADLVGDALNPPPPIRAQSASSDPVPKYYQTSEYFIGRVAVGIVLPESDGSVDPSSEDWSEAERSLVLYEITAALDWWAAREPNAHLTFVYDDGTAAPIATSYEPISRRYSDQSLWIGEVMARKGYTGTSYFDQVRLYNNALRATYHTDWAFTIFVVDSSNDWDNHFSDGYFAYAYLGGPFLVMTYGNDGYGPYNMDAVAAHEIGHIFLALDQYSGAYQSCTRVSGYLGVENQNSQYGDCTSNVSSIMRGGTWPYRDRAIDEYARGQLGWRDSDSDGILDPVDTTLSIVDVDYTPASELSNVLAFTGGVEDAPYPSPLRQSSLINTITQIQYRIQGGPWADAQAADGAFDSYAETFAFTTPSLPTGEVAVELRVVDSAGNELVQALDNVILDTTLTRLDPQNQANDLDRIIYDGHSRSAASYIAAVYYRIDDAPWQPLNAIDGAFDQAEEDVTFSVDLATLAAGTHQVQAYSIDGQGHIEPSPASDFLSIEAAPHNLFLPMISAR